jgi:hypothetical protein
MKKKGKPSSSSACNCLGPVSTQADSEIARGWPPESQSSRILLPSPPISAYLYLPTQSHAAWRLQKDYAHLELIPGG